MKEVTNKTIIKTFLRHLKPFWLIVATITLAIIVAEVLGLIAPWYYKKFFDVLTDGSVPVSNITIVLTRIVLTILGLHLSGWVFYRLATFLSVYYEPRVMANLERSSFQYLLGHAYSFFANTFTGGLVRKVRRLSRAFENLVDCLSWDFLQFVVVVVMTLIMLFLRNWLVAVAVLIWMIIMIIIHVSVALWKLKYDVEKAELDSGVTAVLSDAITNSTNVALFGGKDYEQSLFYRATEKFRRLATFTFTVGMTVEAVQTFLMIGVEFAVFYIGIYFWQRGELTVGDFALFQGYLMLLFGKFWVLGRVIRRVYESIAEAREMVEILETPYQIQDSHSARPLVVSRGEIEFRDVTFSYRQTRRVLSGFNLHIKPGEKVALVGPSGGGKSTIIKLLLRLHDIDSGKILIDGQRISQVTQESLRRQIALVPQDPVLFHRTLADNIRYGRRNATNKEVEAAAKKAHAHDFIKNFPDGYKTYVGERGIKLSGGERQRVAMARAILVNPPILVLDEATSSLDSESESLIQDALRSLMKDKTVIVIAHRLSTILEMDRIVVIDGGKVVDQGTHKQLSRKKGIYKTLWDIQAGGFIQ